MIYCMILVFIFLVYKPLKGYTKFKKEKNKAELILNDIENKDHEERERAMINSSLSLSTFDKIIKIRGKQHDKENTKIHGKKIEETRRAERTRKRYF